MKAKLTLFSASLLSAMLLAGCQNTQVSTQSQIELPRQFSEANAAQGSANIVRWWQHWRDPVMNELIERGLQHNHDIRIAHARLLEARQNSQLARAEESGKPADIVAKMVEGRVNKYLAEITLLGQPFVINPDVTVEKFLKEQGSEVLGFAAFHVGEGIEKKEVDYAAEVAAASKV